MLSSSSTKMKTLDPCLNVKGMKKGWDGMGNSMGEMRYSVNQQILAAIKFGVSQNKVIWRLLNLASPRLCSVRSK